MAVNFNIKFGYRINGVDISQIFEQRNGSDDGMAFGSELRKSHSLFTSADYFRRNEKDLRYTITGSANYPEYGIIPKSAGQEYLGGANTTSAFRVNGAPIDVALKGCRPCDDNIIGSDSPGTVYINRINGQTWFSEQPNSASGYRLDHDPRYVFVELQGGGGGGAGGSALYASSGGAGGGYCFKAVALPENSYIRVEIGAGGNGGAAGTGNNGGTGGNTICYDSAGGFIARAYGGYGGAHNNDYTVEGGTALDGDVNVSGGNGGTKESAGASVAQFTVTFSTPEQQTKTRGGYSGGTSPGNNHGGGGGASAFANGGNGDRDNPTAGRLGSGGGGGGYRLAGTAGASGGDGFVRIYY